VLFKVLCNSKLNIVFGFQHAVANIFSLRILRCHFGSDLSYYCGRHKILIFEYTNYDTMTKQATIERTLEAMKQLPEDKAEEISDFADFVKKRYEENQLSHGMQQMVAESPAFEFLSDEEELYSISDLKVIYNG
jgi:hypothetical protein